MNEIPDTSPSDYLSGLEDIARLGRSDPLEQLILARLRGSNAVIEGLVSPPLGRHEPDANLVFYDLYQRLSDCEAARQYLRRAAVSLYLENLNPSAFDLTLANALGCLIGFFQVAQHESIACGLRLGLWGYLRDHLPKPMEDMMQLEGNDLLRAANTLDLWLAVTPPGCDALNERVRTQIRALFEHAQEQFNNINDERIGLLLLLFRALLLTNPNTAGKTGIFEMAQRVELAQGTRHQFRRRWLGLCWELGHSLNQPHAAQLKTAFQQGLEQDPVPHSKGHELYWASLDRLGFKDDSQGVAANANIISLESRRKKLSLANDPTTPNSQQRSII
ncbi:MAG: hypothetical protein WC091_06120 [Sulfuricellaceae bacterium]